LTPSTKGAIDSCGTTEGGCPKGAPPGPNGATIMSYCVTGVGGGGGFVNFNNGFGPLPGAAIRNFVDNSTCIPDCAACLVGQRKPSSDPSLTNVGFVDEKSQGKEQDQTNTPYGSLPIADLSTPAFAVHNSVRSPYTKVQGSKSPTLADAQK